MRFSGELRMKKLRHYDKRFFHYLCGDCCGNCNDAETATRGLGHHRRRGGRGAAEGEPPCQPSAHFCPPEFSTWRRGRTGFAGSERGGDAGACAPPLMRRQLRGAGRLDAQAKLVYWDACNQCGFLNGIAVVDHRSRRLQLASRFANLYACLPAILPCLFHPHLFCDVDVEFRENHLLDLRAPRFILTSSTWASAG
jgi:hypothetical protein